MALGGGGWNVSLGRVEERARQGYIACVGWSPYHTIILVDSRRCCILTESYYADMRN
jgi:hypothetical protein